MLERKCDKKNIKKTEFWRNSSWLHQDNATANTSLKTTKFVTNNMLIVSHPPYSPDLAPVISICFPN
jgi:hypothetical protein